MNIPGSSRHPIIPSNIVSSTLGTFRQAQKVEWMYYRDRLEICCLGTDYWGAIVFL